MNAWADHLPIFMANPIQRNKIEGQPVSRSNHWEAGTVAALPNAAERSADAGRGVRSGQETAASSLVHGIGLKAALNLSAGNGSSAVQPR
jgi:hypothetical protein